MPGQVQARDRREHVLERVQEVGVEAAAAEAGVQPRTVLRWQEKAAVRLEAEACDVVDAEPVEVARSVDGLPDLSGSVESEEDQERQLRRTAQAARRAVERAIARLDEVLPTARNVQAVAVAAGVLSDKAERLEGILREAQERRVRLTGDQAELLVALLRTFLAAVELPAGDATRHLLSDLLRQAEHGADAIAASPALSAPAAAELREVLRARFSAEVERAQLPAPEDVAESSESGAEQGATPKNCERDFSERAVEVVTDAEVVEYEDDVPRRGPSDDLGMFEGEDENQGDVTR